MAPPDNPMRQKTIFASKRVISVTCKKSPNVYKSCPKMILLEKLNILMPLQKFSQNVGNLGKIIVATGFQSCPKCNKFPNLVTQRAIEQSRTGTEVRSTRNETKANENNNNSNQYLQGKVFGHCLQTKGSLRLVISR